MKKHAFTLAETLITLTIIGVVAAMTIPTLMSKYQKHTYVVGLKKAYAQLQHAFKMVPINEGCPAGDYDCAGWQYSTFGNENLYRLSKSLKVKKYCNNSNDESCKELYDAIDNYIYPGTRSASRALILEDGTIFYLVSPHSNNIVVDINGLKSPNKPGRDMFWFYPLGKETNGIPAGTVIPNGSKLLAQYSGYYYHYWNYTGKKTICTTQNIADYNPESASGSASVWKCAGRVLEEDAMNY